MNNVKYQKREMGGYTAFGEDNDSEFDINERAVYYGMGQDNDFIQ